MKTIKQRLRASLLSIPAFRTRWERSHAQPDAAFVGRPHKEIFTRIYETNYWGDGQSRSGSGSNDDRTAVVRRELPRVLKELGCRSLLDAPCGDASWISTTELGIDRYLGCDIVEPLIEENRRRYARPGRDFAVLDIACDALPKVDLVLCRDLLVHLSNEDGVQVLRNLAGSGSTWLLATTFTRQRENVDIGPGGWRSVNLELPPFSLGAPSMLIDEHCDEHGGIYRDKHLGLWSLQGTHATQQAKG